MIIPEIPGSLNLRHPEACAALEQAAGRGRDGAPRHTRSRFHVRRRTTRAVARRDGRARGAVPHRRGRRRPAVTGAQGARARARADAGDQPRDGPAPRRSRRRGRRARLPRRRRRPVHGRPSTRAAAGRAVPVPQREPGRSLRRARATSRSSSPTARSSACRSGSGSRPAGRPGRSPRTRATTPGSTSRSATVRCWSPTRAVTATRSSARDSRSRCATRASCATCCEATTGAGPHSATTARSGRERMRRLRFIANTVAITEAEDADNRDARRAKWGELLGPTHARSCWSSGLRRTGDRSGRFLRRRTPRRGPRP